MFKKSVLLNLMVICLVLLMTDTASAVQSMTPPPTEETQGDIGIQSFQLLSISECSIDQIGTEANVFVTGSTSTLFEVDSLMVRIYLQRWDGSSWTNVAYKTFNDTNDDFVSGSYSYSISRGYYYRTKAYHTATDGSISESSYSYSGSIYID